MEKPCLFLLFVNIVSIEGPITSKWRECNCRWDDWAAWSACTKTCGGGTQERDRSVWNYDTPNCEGFEACATSDMGFERRSCNTNCYNGGTYKTWTKYYGYCECQEGKIGDCCQDSKCPFILNYASGIFQNVSFYLFI